MGVNTGTLLFLVTVIGGSIIEATKEFPSQSKTVESLDYYWRPYNGNIPSDAIIAGYDKNNTPIYIGQGLAIYGTRYGVIPGTIKPGNKEFYVELIIPKRSDFDVKILCSPSAKKFTWISTTANTFTKDLVERKPILGGFEIAEDENEHVPLYIGRTTTSEGPIVGKIATNITTSYLNKMIYVFGVTDTYEALVYKN